jgi:hypothetical protein
VFGTHSTHVKQQDSKSDTHFGDQFKTENDEVGGETLKNESQWSKPGAKKREMAVGMSKRGKDSDVGREDPDIFIEETYSPDVIRDL